MKLKSILGHTLFLTWAFAGLASASPAWTVTTKGTISSGIDNDGIFGSAAQALSGLAYTLTLTTESGQLRNETIDSRNPWFYSIYGDGGPAFTTTVSINGKTISLYSPDSWWLYQGISSGISTGQVGSAMAPVSDRIAAQAGGAVGPGQYINVSSILYTYDAANAFVPTLDFAQTIDFKPKGSVDGQSTFRLGGAMDPSMVSFSGSIDLIQVNVRDEPSHVPEPRSVALIGLALTGLILARRRKA